MEEEIQAHIEGLTDRNVAAGMTEKKARCAARQAFGHLDQIKEEARDQRGIQWVEQFGQDLRYAARTLRKNPLFTGVAIITLAVGMGANTAVFSVFDAVLLGRLPYPESDRLIAMWERHDNRSDRNVVSSGNFHDWREQNTVFEAVEAYSPIGAVLRGEEGPQQTTGSVVTPGMFTMLQLGPKMGRGFRSGADAEAEGREIVISHALWQTRYSGRPDIVGLLVHLDDTPMTIVGVMPEAFQFPTSNTNFWLTMRHDAEERDERRAHRLQVLGRLKTGVGLVEAQTEMDVIASRAQEDYPEFMTGWWVNLVPFRDDLVRNSRATISILMGMVALVLLVACANVGNLMLARSAGRQRELAIRGALGAGRGRIMRQLLTESILLAGLGAVGGLFFATWTMEFLKALMPVSLPGMAMPHLSLRTLAATAGALVLATGVVGFAPAWWLSRIELRSFLQGGRSESGSVLLRRTRNSLLVVQLALATILLVGSGLLLRSMSNLQKVDFGFEPRELLAATVNLPRTRYETSESHEAFYARLLPKLAAIPGVLKVSAVSDPPLSGASTFGFVIEGRPRPGPNPRETPVEMHGVTPGYFETMKVPFFRGRDFANSDRAETPLVVVINRAFERQHFPEGDAIGQRISNVDHGGPWREIVGVVGDVKDKGLDQRASPAMYTPYLQKRDWQSALTVMVRTEGDPMRVENNIRQAFQAIDTEVPVRRLVSMPVLYASRLAQRDFMAQLTTGFALLALGLGVIGVYGVVSYSVVQRRREFGICLALGARRSDIVGRVMGEGFKLVLLGTILGALGAMSFARLLGNFLFEVQPLDLPTFIGVGGLLGGISLVALWLPARRAAGINPMVALRCE